MERKPGSRTMRSFQQKYEYFLEFPCTTHRARLSLTYPTWHASNNAGCLGVSSLPCYSVRFCSIPSLMIHCEIDTSTHAVHARPALLPLLLTKQQMETYSLVCMGHNQVVISNLRQAARNQPGCNHSLEPFPHSRLLVTLQLCKIQLGLKIDRYVPEFIQGLYSPRPFSEPKLLAAFD
jgi:hypothetical protein